MFSIMFYRRYVFGEVAVHYLEVPIEGHEGLTTVALCVRAKDEVLDVSSFPMDSMVQPCFAGDRALIDYTQGVTMLCASSCVVSVLSQTLERQTVTTRLTDGMGNLYTHTLCYFPERDIFSVRIGYENLSGETRILESFPSITLSGISQLGGLGTEGMTLVRMTSAWSRECRIKRDSFDSLGMDMSWARYGVKCERWGQVGSMPNRGYYPFAAIEADSYTLALTIEAPYSWQMQLYKEKETCTLSAGLTDFEFGHWRKEIPSGGSFLSDTAYFVFKRGGLEEACNALVHAADDRLCVPQEEEDMPVLFNEYCTTWGCPSEGNIRNILNALSPLPIDIFVIDCGWYKPDDRGWCNAIGDWKQSQALFPTGISSVAERIRAAGMIPGIWFEYEVVGCDSEAFCRDELLLKRDGKVITSKNRRFLDLRKAETDNYLCEKFLNFLKQNKFGYLKIDYNDTYGLGCDGAESVGEGGRQVAQKSIDWLDTLRREIPELIIENCSSGGSRIEPMRMGKVSMCSFSDAHECAEIPLVAACVSRIIPARQMQIWAVLRNGEPISRTVYSLCAAMMGRICLSGDVLNLSEEQVSWLKRGFDFYFSVKDIVRHGDIDKIDCSVEYYRNPVGRQIYVKRYQRKTLIIVHCLDWEGELNLCVSGKLQSAYTTLDFSVEGNFLRVEGKKYQAGAFLFKEET